MDNRRKGRKIVSLVLVILIILTTNIVTFFFARYYPVLTGKSIIVDADDTVTAENINKLIYLKEQLKENYLWGFEEQDLWDSALKGLMAGTGDPYSSYMTKEEFDAYKESVSGSYVGIGIQVMNNAEGNVQITKVFANSPAEKAGIQIDDIITSADDTSLLNTTVDYAVTLIKGEEGTTVKIGIRRGTEELTLTVGRAVIEQVNVSSEMLENNIGYIHVYEFIDGTYERFDAAVKDLTAKGMKGLILDLRQNPGGNVSDALQIADELLPEGDIIYTLDNKNDKQVEKSDADSISVPVICMVDGYSASASEIVAASLQDNKAAIIVGTKSYGKGIMQTLIPMTDGSMYKYTFREYYVPSGTKIHGVGITPDYVVEKGEQYDKTLIENIPHESDLQLIKAIEVMKLKIQ